jgi:hypothetical protein
LLIGGKDTSAGERHLRVLNNMVENMREMMVIV